MSSFILKIIAMLSMVFDHLGYTLYGTFSNFNYLGRLAFPIFAFQISEGYQHTRSKKNYLLRLFLFALISQIPFMLFSSTFREGFALNIFFTLCIGILAIFGYEQIQNKILGILFAICLSFTADVIHADYGSWGVLLIFIFHLFKSNKKIMNLLVVLAILLKYLPNYILYQFHPAYIFLAMGTLASLIFINLYNGKKGKDTKYLLYSFYPLHLLLFYLIHTLWIG